MHILYLSRLFHDSWKFCWFFSLFLFSLFAFQSPYSRSVSQLPTQFPFIPAPLVQHAHKDLTQPLPGEDAMSASTCLAFPLGAKPPLCCLSIWNVAWEARVVPKMGSMYV